MFLVGEYTRLPAWVPARAGDGIAALYPTEDGGWAEKCVCSIENPSYVIPDGEDGLYAVSEAEQGAIAHLIRTEDGTYREDAFLRFPGSGSCHLCLEQETRRVFVSNYNSGSLVVVDGHPGAMKVLQELRYSGCGPDPKRQEAPHIHSSWLSPNGKELFVADLGTDRIYRYLLGKEIPLTPNARQPWITCPPGSGPRHMVFHDTMPLAYVTTEMGNQVLLIRFDQENIGTVCEGWSTAEEKNGLILTAHLQLSLKYGMLYVSVRGTDEICWFRVEPSTGRLTPEGKCPAGGRFPRHFLLDEESGLLLVANQLSGSVCVFSLGADGTVSAQPLQSIPAPGAAVIVKTEDKGNTRK